MGMLWKFSSVIVLFLERSFSVELEVEEKRPQILSSAGGRVQPAAASRLAAASIQSSGRFQTSGGFHPVERRVHPTVASCLAAFTSIVDFASLLARSLSLLIFPRTSFQSSLNAILQETVIVKKRLRDEDVYDYLVGTVACNQTREQINEFLEKSKKYKLAKAEILSIINTRPSQLVELDPVSKDVKYADKMPLIPWGPRFTKSSQKDMQINLAISAVFTAWILIKRNAAYKPLQFLAFAFVYRLFEKLKATEPAVSPTLTEDGEDDGKGLRMGKRLLRSLALSFGCIAFASLAYTCILNVVEYTSGFIPIVLYNNQEPIITAVSAVSLYILASYYR
ncbi:Protein CHLOROPLAST J-LIKE DOMAIN 1, chloroplastic [Linum perenne]